MRHVILLVFWLYLIAVCALLLFAKGFLLKRIVVSNVSSCIPNNWLVNNLWNGVTKTIIVQQPSEKHQCNNLIRPRFKKAILVIIDGLRYDFLTYDETLDLKQVLPFQNKMTKLHALLRDQPHNGKLFKFEADPPTTTMQRIKGMTTGSLPTFIDAGTNFNSYEITEDNLISQALKQGKNVTFMGCSTWTELYPNHFNRKIPFSALNVKDLDTIDYGIMRNLVKEVKRDDWSLLIAHFLGVDHCGHRYGTHHPEMTRKLKEMDGVISDLTAAMDEETVLFLMGDHGMTRSGDHGGDSPDEVMAGLFTYSKKGLFHASQTTRELQQVSQIDMVPTVSILLDQPIPFSNLGSIIPDFFLGPADKFLPPFLDSLTDEKVRNASSRLFQQMNMAYGSLLNCKQLFDFISQYQVLSSDLPDAPVEAARASLEFLDEKFEEYLEEVLAFPWNSPSQLKLWQLEESVQELNSIHISLQEVLKTVKTLCRSVWAKFDEYAITFGLTMLFFMGFISLLVACTVKNDERFSVLFFLLGILMCITSVLVNVVKYFDHANHDSAFAFVVVSFSLSVWVLSVIANPKAPIAIEKFLKISFYFATFRSIVRAPWFPFALCFFGQSVTLFSNSYIIYEDTVTLYVCQTLLVVSALHSIFKVVNKTQETGQIKMASSSSSSVSGSNINVGSKTLINRFKDPGRTFVFTRTKVLQHMKENSIMILSYAVAMICMRVTKNFWFCREMQLTCSLSSYALPLASLLSEFTEGHANERMLVALLACVVIVAVTQYWLRTCGNLNGNTPMAWIVRLLSVVMFILILLHWCLQLVLAHPFAAVVDVAYLQQITLPRIVYCLFFICLFALVRNPLSVYRRVKNYRTVTEIYQRIKESLSNEDKPIVVYGLKTVYSSSFLTLMYILLVVTCMVMTDGMALPLCALWCASFVIVKQFSVQRTSKQFSLRGYSPQKDTLGLNDLEGMGVSHIFCSVVAWIFFTWYAFYGSGHQTTIPAIRFHAAYIGFKGSIPEIVPQVLVILLNTYGAQIICSLALPLLVIVQDNLKNAGTNSEEQGKGEVDLVENTTRSWFLLFRLVLMFMALSILKLSFAAGSAAYHRRHLMVWKIFAPRFLFEAVSFLLSIPMACLGLAFYGRIETCLKRWLQELKQD